MATGMLMSPVRPGEILLTEFLEPLGMSQYQLAKAYHGAVLADALMPADGA